MTDRPVLEAVGEVLRPWPFGEDDTDADVMAGSAYQVVANLAFQFGVFDHPEVMRALDYFSGMTPQSEGLLPWPRTPLSPTPIVNAGEGEA